MIRLGILDAVPPEYYLPGEKTDPEKFIDLFRSIDAPLSFLTFDATEGHFPQSLDECDAYLITGSPCSVYDTYTWIGDMQNFIRSVLASGVPLVGICFGHQLIAQTLGGKVRLSNHGWMLGLHDLWVRTTKDWMRDASHSHPLYFVNQDQVVELPPGVEHLGGSDHCPHAMYAIDNKLLALQAHPEQPHSSIRAFTEDIVERYKLDPAIAEEAYRTMEAAEPDAALIAEWISAFLQSAYSSRADS